MENWTTLLQEWGQYVRRVMDSKGISYETLASKAGLSEGRIRYLLRNPTNCTIQTLWKINNAMEIKTPPPFVAEDELLEDSEDEDVTASSDENDAEDEEWEDEELFA